MPTLIIDSIEIPIESLLSFSQQYTDEGAIDFKRTADGSGIVRELWTGKLSTQITGQGWVPGLDAFARGQSHTISCVTPRVVSATGTTITLPAARRNDTGHAPFAHALVAGELVATTITNLADINAGTSDAATLTAVSGAAGYRVTYWPKIVAAIRSQTHSGDQRADFTWTIEAEEV